MVSSAKSSSFMEASSRVVNRKLVGVITGIMLIAGTYFFSLLDQGEIFLRAPFVVPYFFKLIYFVIAWLFADSIYGQTERGTRLVWLAPLAAGLYLAGNSHRYACAAINFSAPEGMPLFVSCIFELLFCVALSACVAAVCAAVNRRRSSAGANTALLSKKTEHPAFSAKALPFCALSFAAAYLAVIVCTYLSSVAFDFLFYFPNWLVSLFSFIFAVALVCFVFRKKADSLNSARFLTASVCFGILYFALDGLFMLAVDNWLIPAPESFRALGIFLPEGSTALFAAGVCIASYLVLFCRRTRKVN